MASKLDPYQRKHTNTQPTIKKKLHLYKASSFRGDQDLRASLVILFFFVFLWILAPFGGCENLPVALSE